MTAPQAAVQVGAKQPRANKKLLIVLAVVIVLALASQVFPSVLGGGGAVKPFNPSTVFHHKAAAPATSGTSTGSPTLTGRPARDPFAPPPGVVVPH